MQNLKKLDVFSKIHFRHYQFVFLLIIYVECTIIKNNIFNWNHEFFNLNTIFLHYTKIPLLLSGILLFWLYVWGLSIWRRTLFGRFTRGDRDLWAKALSSFWVVEFTTFFGFYIALCLCTWGPTPLFPRALYFSKKTFYLELTFFTYIIWLIYYLKLTMRTQLWKTQLIISSFILVICGYLFWRNFIGLFTREVYGSDAQIQWRYTHRLAVVYALDKNLWFNHQFGDKKNIDSGFISMGEFLQNGGTGDPFLTMPSKITHETDNTRNLMDIVDYYTPLTVVLSLKKNDFLHYWHMYKFSNTSAEKFSVFWYCSVLTSDDFVGLDFYPCRAGYKPKRYSAWQFLTLLKIWHTLMLLIWWVLFIFKLKTFKKASFPIIHAAYFNVFCCFIMSYFVYYILTLPYLECWLRMKVRFWTWTRVPYLNYCMIDYVWDSFLPQWYIEFRESPWLSKRQNYDNKTISTAYAESMINFWKNKIYEMVEK